MDAARKAGIDAAKTASKRVVQKMQKLQEIQLEIKQLIKLLLQVNQKKKKKKKQINQKKFIFRQKKDNKLLMILDYFEYS